MCLFTLAEFQNLKSIVRARLSSRYDWFKMEQRVLHVLCVILGGLPCAVFTIIRSRKEQCGRVVVVVAPLDRRRRERLGARTTLTYS